MSGIALHLDMKALSSRLHRFIDHVEHIDMVMNDAARYMVNSTVDRITKTKLSPKGDRWAALSAVAAELKGHDDILVESGELGNSVRVADYSNEGFEIIADSDHAAYMQDGVKTVKGRFRSKRPKPQVPARPFMGFSEENNRRIAQMLREHLER